MNASLEKPITILRRFAIFALIIFAIAKVALPSWNRVKIWQLNDNDDIMRVLEVRAWLNGQGFYDLVNHRLNPPNGGDIHWSRLADIPLALVQLILRPFVGIDMAEKMGAFAVPLILAVIFAYVVGRAAKTVSKSYLSLYIGAFMAISTPSAMGYFSAGRVDHHGLQLIFMVCTFWGLMAHDKKGAMLAGLSIAASLTIGFELAPILVLMVAWVAIVWGIRGEEAREQTKFFALWLGIGSVIGFLINVPPSEYFIGVNDAISIAQLAPLLSGCLMLFLIAHIFSARFVFTRFVGLLLIGVIVILVALQFPILLRQPYWQIDPLLRRIWLSAIMETFPLTRLDKSLAITLGTFAILTSIAVIIKTIFVILDKRQNQNHRDVDNWLLLASVLTITSLLTVFWQTRIAGQAATIAIIAAAALLANLYKEKSLAWALAVGLIINPLVPTIVASAYTKLKPKTNTGYSVGGGVNCNNIKVFSELAKMPKGKILANIDFGTRALIATHHDVLAAPYHRNGGNFIAYDIFLTNADNALAKIKANNVQYVAYCKKSAETGIMEREAPNGLMADLKKGKIPDYLQPIKTPNGSDIISFSVVK